jgi:hypothetical protein
MTGRRDGKGEGRQGKAGKKKPAGEQAASFATVPAIKNFTPLFGRGEVSAVRLSEVV